MDFKKKILELQPTELMVLITVLLVMLGGSNLYSYFSALGVEFLIKDITISLLVMSTFKLCVYFLLCLVIAYLIFRLGTVLAYLLNLFFSVLGFEDIKEHSSLLWIIFASIPALVFLLYFIYDDSFKDFRTLVLLIFFSCTPLVFKEINNKFSIEDINVLICLFISCFAIGSYQAKIDSDIKKSRLAKIENYGKNQDWRILTYLNENVVLMNLTKVSDKTEFKIVKLEDLNFSTNKKRAE